MMTLRRTSADGNDVAGPVVLDEAAPVRYLDDEVRPEAPRLEAVRRRQLAQAIERVGRDEVDRTEVEEGPGGRAEGGRHVRHEVAFPPARTAWCRRAVRP